MCIITLLNSKNKIINEIKRDVLETAWESNTDGAGYSYTVMKNKKFESINIKKGFTKFNNFYKEFCKDRDRNVHSRFMIHFRYGNQGIIDVSNCHPFSIYKDKVAMAHNGTIHKMDSKKDAGKSDSRLFAEMLKDLPLNWYMNNAYRILFEKYIGETNRIAIHSYDNNIIIFNQSKWIKEEDIYFSSEWYKTKRNKYDTSTTGATNNYNVTKCNNCNNNAYYFINSGNYCYHCYEKLKNAYKTEKCGDCDIELISFQEKQAGYCYGCLEKKNNKLIAVGI